MKQALLFIYLSLSFWLSLSAQVKNDSLGKRKPQNVVFALKGIALPYLLGNGSGISNNLGIEMVFAKNHSLGINGAYHPSGGSHDMVTDTAGIKHDVGQYYYNREKAFAVNYRYYFSFNNFKKKHKTFYTTLIYRYSKTSRFDDPAYKTDYISQYETKTTSAFAIGMLSRLKNINRLRLDINIGVANSNVNTDTEFRQNGMLKYKFEKRSKIGLWIGLTFGYYFLRY